MKLFFNLLTTVSLVVGQFSAPINKANSPLLQEPLTPTPTETVTATATATETVTPIFNEPLTPFAEDTFTATNTPETVSYTHLTLPTSDLV